MDGKRRPSPHNVHLRSDLQVDNTNALAHLWLRLLNNAQPNPHHEDGDGYETYSRHASKFLRFQRRHRSVVLSNFLKLVRCSSILWAERLASHSHRTTYRGGSASASKKDQSFSPRTLPRRSHDPFQEPLPTFTPACGCGSFDTSTWQCHSLTRIDRGSLKPH